MQNRKKSVPWLRTLVAGLALALPLAAPSQQQAEQGGFVYRQQVRAPLDQVYPQVYRELEASRFFVVQELNIGKQLARNAERWGEDYNRNRIEAVRAMVICNPWYANQLLNLDPDLMALCPLNVMLLHKQGMSTVQYRRLQPAAVGSPAEELLWEVDNRIIAVIESALANLGAADEAAP